jgi:hypothetical protein
MATPDVGSPIFGIKAFGIKNLDELEELQYILKKVVGRY